LPSLRARGTPFSVGSLLTAVPLSLRPTTQAYYGWVREIKVNGIVHKLFTIQSKEDNSVLPKGEMALRGIQKKANSLSSFSHLASFVDCYFTVHAGDGGLVYTEVAAPGSSYGNFVLEQELPVHFSAAWSNSNHQVKSWHDESKDTRIRKSEKVKR